MIAPCIFLLSVHSLICLFLEPSRETARLAKLDFRFRPCSLPSCGIWTGLVHCSRGQKVVRIPLGQFCNLAGDPEVKEEPFIRRLRGRGSVKNICFYEREAIETRERSF